MRTESHETEFKIDSEFEEKSAETFYDRFYAKATAELMKWRDFGAVEKCNSVLELCTGSEVHSVVEIGCGLCNLISRLDKLRFAREFYGLEVSSSAVRFIKERIHIPRLRAVYLLDTCKTPFEDDFFDLGILSHVIEHVANPIALLKETLRICKFVVVEVPLEDCLSLNLYSKLREKVTGFKRMDNRTGHIHFFDKSTIRKIVMECKGRILRERTYRIWRVFNTGFRPIPLLQYFQSILFFLIYKITNSKVVGSHYAVLARKTHTP